MTWRRSGGGESVLGLGSLDYVTGGDVHVYPLEDLREHQVGQGDGTQCWCGPKRDEECQGVVVHNALDGREEYEDGSRKPH